MSSHSPVPVAPPRLIFPALIFALSLAVALVFTSAFEEAPEFSVGELGCGIPAELDATPTETHATHSKKKAVPVYYVGGLWSDAYGLAATLDLAILSAIGGQPVVCQSAHSAGGETLTIIDNSPIQYTKPAAQDAKPILILSIDYAGSALSEEYPAAGQVQKYITAQLDNYSSILVIEPLPGPKTDADKEWTYLNFNGDDKVTFFEPKRSDRPVVTAMTVYTQLRGSAPPTAQPLATLMEQVAGEDQAKAADARWLLAQQSPYEVIPALNNWIATADANARGKRVYEALMIRRALGVHADDLIAEAAASENPALRALAARSIGDLADVTTAPIAILTPLAEDGEMSVRYEALASCLAMPGRRAAGVAQLVEPYEMNDAMRSAYQGVMAQLLTYGEPIQADSRANRLRRMPIAELLKQERDALVCRILLESTDLPDDKIDEVLGQLATFNGRGPLTELLDLLETINPRTLAKREVLLKHLVAWKTNELEAQTPRLKELALGNGTQNLRSAAAGALIRTHGPGRVIELLGTRPIAYQGLGWVNDKGVVGKWQIILIDTANADEAVLDAGIKSRIAAIDSIQFLPADAITKKNASSLLSLANESDAIDLRFAAIRALNRLPAAVKPDDMGELQLIVIDIAAVPGQMKYDKEKLTVTAGRPVELTLTNPDTMEHNLVVTLPGRAQEIGIDMSADPTAAAAIGYVPKDNDAVLAYTKMTAPGTSDTLRFFAPTKPGTYDYVCTFPGHYTSMRGVLEVVAP